ncbi:MAG: dimethyl sulfoxide reductase anchor subunit [Candidatus Aminicenantes bacterium]|nr:dimethyl sulfoxide reductase anchor subunit [Candidatus Aminicenantes bacterium]
MAWREWPLVAFTLLGQLATGFYLFFVVPVMFVGRPAQGSEGRNAILYATAAVIGMLGVAAAASFFHLGRPLKAPNALSNLRTSWLSREILFELLFLISLAGLFVLVWLGRGEGVPAKAAAGLAGSFGILFLVSMARLYMVPGVPAWNRAATPVSFFLATMTLGSLGALAVSEVISGAYQIEEGTLLPGPSWLRALTVFAAALVALGVVGYVLLTSNHGVLRSRAAASLKPAVASPAVFFVLRFVLLAGCGLALLAAFRSGLGGGAGTRGGANLVLIAFGLAAVSELLARFEFYGLGDGRRSF